MNYQPVWVRHCVKRKLILLVIDGELVDIDERDPQHLRHDTKKSVEELYHNGVLTY